MSNVSKRRREGPRTKIKSMGDHKEFLKRITKTLYYGHLPTLPCLSLPVTEVSCAAWSAAQRGRSLRRLHVDAAARVARGACVSPCALVLALLYLERLHACSPDYLLAAAPHDLFLISLMVGNKFLQDDGEDEEVIGSEWAATGGLDLKQLNQLELEFLDAIDWNIFVNEESFEAGLSRLERQVALRQARARGYFTYGDLAAACDGALLRALAAACLAVCSLAVATLAALLASALLVAPARPALQPALAPPPRPPATFLNNDTAELAIDALAARLGDTERVTCCAAWARPPRPRASPSEAEVARGEPWWSKSSALSWVYCGTLVSPVRRWLERVAEYAELTRTAPAPAAGPRPWDDVDRSAGPDGQRCMRQWLNLSRLSALLATVSDR